MEDRPLGAESSLTDSLGARIADQLHNEGSEGGRLVGVSDGHQRP